MPDAPVKTKMDDVEKAEGAVTDAKRKFYKSKRRLKDFEQVHGLKPEGKPATAWQVLVNECNELSGIWSKCKAAATAARQAARTDAENAA